MRGMNAVVIVFGESQTYKFSLPVTDAEANNIIKNALGTLRLVQGLPGPATSIRAFGQGQGRHADVSLAAVGD